MTSPNKDITMSQPSSMSTLITEAILKEPVTQDPRGITPATNPPSTTSMAEAFNNALAQQASQFATIIKTLEKKIEDLSVPGSNAKINHPPPVEKTQASSMASSSCAYQGLTPSTSKSNHSLPRKGTTVPLTSSQKIRRPIPRKRHLLQVASSVFPVDFQQ
ncbi:uncharacterized protein MELLADRAFT_68351 [Melampsora larici-populina 98AG31]|uniref:Uncharacterized protein n=1 Tax=Melampsora larici-populina (strain 98AG31 / pathotype 3-4-7) TaxID=747676 RepID=F4S6H4_MELLP|nr:uncharacterized protein MELLADRAFT_68351 [Melampsora larici-populina 98AG31]EGF99759.1 hypothetical protein MELLADRAFT_68351 [Melampsora larici-populina 98AG31]